MRFSPGPMKLSVIPGCPYYAGVHCIDKCKICNIISTFMIFRRFLSIHQRPGQEIQRGLY